jgi:hypothetical protein
MNDDSSVLFMFLREVASLSGAIHEFVIKALSRLKIVKWVLVLAPI